MWNGGLIDIPASFACFFARASASSFSRFSRLIRSFSLSPLISPGGPLPPIPSPTLDDERERPNNRNLLPLALPDTVPDGARFNGITVVAPGVTLEEDKEEDEEDEEEEGGG